MPAQVLKYAITDEKSCLHFKGTVMIFYFRARFGKLTPVILKLQLKSQFSAYSNILYIVYNIEVTDAKPMKTMNELINQTSEIMKQCTV